MASGITYAGKAIENINIANETSYLKKLIGGGGGNATWAASQLNVLNKAADAYNTVLAKASSATKAAAEAVPAKTAEQAAAGAGDVSIPIDTTGYQGYDPAAYTASASSGSGLSGSSIFGYAVVGLVMVVVLDRLMK